MKKNGAAFLQIVSRSNFRCSVWDPYEYRQGSYQECLGAFANVVPLSASGQPGNVWRFAPVEYRHIARGRLPLFMVEAHSAESAVGLRYAPEGSLLFGTMRAYLGNLAVIPLAEWIGEAASFNASVKSEFVRVIPKDGLTFFWWAYLQSQQFLHNLPIGSGGTRPRVNCAGLAQTPVSIPEESVRAELHRQLQESSKTMWKQYIMTDGNISEIIGL
jgi:hypothetical protein